MNTPQEKARPGVATGKGIDKALFVLCLSPT
jgi:hypothetical protein